LEVLNG
jgi:hypothetical protein